MASKSVTAFPRQGFLLVLTAAWLISACSSDTVADKKDSGGTTRGDAAGALAGTGGHVGTGGALGAGGTLGTGGASVLGPDGGTGGVDANGTDAKPSGTGGRTGGSG